MATNTTIPTHGIQNSWLGSRLDNLDRQSVWKYWPGTDKRRNLDFWICIDLWIFIDFQRILMEMAVLVHPQLCERIRSLRLALVIKCDRNNHSKSKNVIGMLIHVR